MKSTLVRSFVLVLVVAGFSASSVSAAAKKTAANAAVAPLAAIGSPVPLCPMHQPDGCGID